MAKDKGAPNGPRLTPGAILTEIPRFVLDSAMGALRSRFGAPAPTPQQSPTQTPDLSDPNAPPSPALQNELNQLGARMPRERREPWFGPSQPTQGIAPRGDVAGRARDYQTAYNLSLTPRQYESMTFPMLRGLFEGLDLAKLCVETRKNQMASLSWEIMPRMAPGENVRQRDDPRCAQLEAFFRSPDRIHNWDTWMRMLLHEMMVIDAPALYVRRTLGGDVYAIEVIDGAEIIPRIDKLGRIPAPPEPAYTHILKGVPAINYTSDELVYFPRNLRAGRVYGQSPIELIGMTIQIAIRRDINKLQFWTEGNIPDALIGTPETWTPEQINMMQELFDNWTSDQANRRKAYFIPGGTNYYPTRPAQTLDPQQDEWLARVITYAFNLPNLPLVNQQNRATSETANDQGLREGLAPTIVWLKGLMDFIIQKVFGYPDIEWTMDSAREETPDALSTRQLAEVQKGAMSLDEYRAERGLPALGMKHAIYGVGPMGIMFVEDLIKAQQMGLLMPPMPAAPDAGAGTGSPYDTAPPGQPQIGAQASSPQAFPKPGAPRMLLSSTAAARLKASPPVSELGNHKMAELSPKLLSAVGLQTDYSRIARPGGKPPSKAGPPVVLSTLQHHESRFKNTGGKTAPRPPPKP